MEVVLYGFQTQVAFVRDLLIATAITNQLRQLLFSPGELSRAFRCARVRLARRHLN